MLFLLLVSFFSSLDMFLSLKSKKPIAIVGAHRSTCLVASIQGQNRATSPFKLYLLHFFSLFDCLFITSQLRSLTFLSEYQPALFSLTFPALSYVTALADRICPDPALT
mmetsp:Transcript_14453/g.15959  ORF Transcript_14453/g.15959 Transcript_14453/m.15959 type:complete len:109 (+) Transcript_14453:1235-1561(+)